MTSTVIKLRLTKADQAILFNEASEPLIRPTGPTSKPKTNSKRCSWCTLKITGDPVKIPYDKEKDKGYLMKGQFNHDRCMWAWVERFLPREKDKINKYILELYGKPIVPASEKEIMDTYSSSPKAITSEQYMELLGQPSIFVKTVYPPLTTPITGEVFMFKAK